MKAYSTKRVIIIRKRIVKKKPSKRVIKQGKKMCEQCKKRFDPDCIIVHHIKIKRRTMPKKETEGMHIVGFEKYYGDRRKRPLHDRRDNIILLCPSCYKDASKKASR